MSLSRLLLASLLLACTQGCGMGDASDPEIGLPSGGAGGAAGGATTSDEPSYGRDDGAGGTASALAPGATGAGGEDPRGGGGAGGRGDGQGGGGAGNASEECPTCCTGEPNPGHDAIYMRVDDSSSFASPLLTRAIVGEWDGERPLPVRRHEFLNFYPPSVPTLETGTGFTWARGAGPVAPLAQNRVFALDVAVRHEPTSHAVGRTIALVIDTSPSAAEAVEELLGTVDAVFLQLEQGDSVGVYSWASDPQLRLIRPVTPVVDVDDEIARVRDVVLEQLALDDRDAVLGPPLRAAISDVQAVALPDHEGTVVLVSDGSSAVDAETLTAVADAAGASARKVRVLGVGVGDARYYSDDVLDRITDASGGAYVFFDGSDEARSLLGDRFRELSEVAAQDVRLRVDLPPSLELLKADGSNADIGDASEVVGQNLGWGGTMTFHQEIQWSGAPGTECDMLTWAVVRGRTTETTSEEVLAAGTAIVGDVFGGLLVTDAFRQSTAIVAAADALRGPTQRRLTDAVATLRDVHASLEGSGAGNAAALADLCNTLVRACERKGFACGTCDASAQGEAP